MLAFLYEFYLGLQVLAKAHLPWPKCADLLKNRKWPCVAVDEVGVI